jgi:uncharacterized protein YgiM (DUF1202 family)
MIEQDLSSRIRQRSRQSGLFIAITLVITIAVALFSFIWAYVRLDPLFRDFVPRAPVVTPTTATRSAMLVASPTPTPSTASTPTPPRPPTTPTASAWKATHRVAGNEAVNLRAGPGTNFDVVRVLDPGTPLQFLGETQQAGGATWLHLALQDGTQGWIRSIDLEPLNP